MMQKQELLQQYVARTKEKENANSRETHPNAHNGKFIVQMQLCVRCSRTFPFKKGRKNCPYCQATLKTRATVLKAP